MVRIGYASRLRPKSFLRTPTRCFSSLIVDTAINRMEGARMLSCNDNGRKITMNTNTGKLK
jgi:hypothetical protein